MIETPFRFIDGNYTVAYNSLHRKDALVTEIPLSFIYGNDA
jgi:hypothetical protein